MNSVRPSILSRPQHGPSRRGEETLNDAWEKEEKRLEARRARLASYETQFRVTHTHQVTAEERRERIDSLQKAHDMILTSHNAVKNREKNNERDFARSQTMALAQQKMEDDAKAAAKRQAAVETMRMNRRIAEEKREQSRVNRRVESNYDNAMIQQTLSQPRTFLY
jgi:hypothetical protein